MRFDPDADPAAIASRIRSEGPLRRKGANCSHVGATFELYRDREGKYRWRLRHANGHAFVDSGEGYASRTKAV